MIIEKSRNNSGIKSYKVFSATQEWNERMKRNINMPGLWIHFHEEFEGGPLIADLDKITEEHVNMLVSSRRIKGKAAIAKKKKEIYNDLKTYIEEHPDWEMKKVFPYISQEDRAKQFARQAIENLKQVNPDIDLTELVAQGSDNDENAANNENTIQD